MASDSNLRTEGGDEDLTSSAYGTAASFDVATSKKLTPQPWHRPRKQWVREQQWGRLIQEFLAAKLSAKEGVLQYLTLPGPDLLDVRLVAKLCASVGYQLKLLGFNDSGSDASSANKATEVANAAYSADESLTPLWMNGSVSRDSFIYRDSVHSLAEPKSIGMTRLAQMGSMDVINLDLCNSLACLEPEGTDPTNYEAVRALFDFQRHHRHKPFLVFLTTRTDPSRVNPRAFERLVDRMLANCQDTRFNTRLFEHFGFSKHHLTAFRERRNPQPPARFFPRIVLMGLSKWMLGLLLGGSPKWKIELLSSCEYSVHRRGGREMLSICYQCEMIKTNAIDGTKLSGTSIVTTAALQEIDYALTILKSAANVFDLDEYIVAKKAYGPLVDSSADLMADAGYDRAAYMDWCFDPAMHPLLDIPAR